MLKFNNTAFKNDLGLSYGLGSPQSLSLDLKISCMRHGFRKGLVNGYRHSI